MGWVHYDNLNVPIRANIEVINSFLSKMIQYILPSMC